MATAICEQIALKVLQRLQLISQSSGYETTVAGTVIRAEKIWNGNLKDYQITITQTSNTYNETMSHPGNPPAIAWDLVFTVFGEIRPSEDDTMSFDALCNEFASDMVKAITVPAANWHNWDGLAINTVFNTITNVNAEEIGGARLEFTVIYRTDETNPYTVRT
jgi:hypothetical protein